MVYRGLISTFFIPSSEFEVKVTHLKLSCLNVFYVISLHYFQMSFLRISSIYICYDAILVPSQIIRKKLMADHANGIVVNVKDLILNILFRFCARYLQTSK